jgi:hypothetical protein
MFSVDNSELTTSVNEKLFGTESNGNHNVYKENLSVSKLHIQFTTKQSVK